MSLSTASSAPNGHPAPKVWPLVASYLADPCAAATAIVFPYYNLIYKSAQQLGRPVSRMSMRECIIAGLKGAPTVGAIVGTQIVLQGFVEKAIGGDKPSLASTFASAAVVGVASAPLLSAFNAQAAKMPVLATLRKLSAKQVSAIAFQETAFVGGLSIAKRLELVMKHKFGDTKVVEYSAAYTAGALGSLVGHPANTALTRLQNGMTFTLRQSMLGVCRKTHAIGVFSALYKLSKETIHSTLEPYK